MSRELGDSRRVVKKKVIQRLNGMVSLFHKRIEE